MKSTSDRGKLLQGVNFGGFEASGNWYKGNIHLHTTRSDGRLTPHEVVDRYRNAGYDFIAITDHEFNAGGKPVKPHPAAELTQHGFLVLTGAEYELRLRREMVHLCAIGPGFDTAPPRDAEPAAVLRDWWERGAFAWWAHPYWSNNGTVLLEESDFLPALEVYNHSAEVGDEKGFSRVHWDRMLAIGRPLTALAVDDAHAEHDVHGGWVMVKSPRLDSDAILAALRRGDFYASCGPIIESVAFDESRNLRVCCSPVERIRVYSLWGGTTTACAESGKPLREATLNLDWFWKTDFYNFLRVEFEDMQGRRAWTQAVLKAPAEAKREP